MKLTVFGLGYIGTITSACMARSGHRIVGVDSASNKVEMLNAGISPIIEPGIQEMVSESVKSGRLRGTTDVDDALDGTEAVFICVGTPSNSEGEVELCYVRRVTAELFGSKSFWQGKPYVIYRSTMPPGSMDSIFQEIIAPRIGGGVKNGGIRILYHPEFLREGNGISDFFESPRIVAAPFYGLSNIEVETLLTNIYINIDYQANITDTRTAEMIKYVDNTFHALKITFANEIGRICKSLGLNTHDLIKIFTSDTKLNISPVYLKPGYAFGGSCLPKDLRGLIGLARKCQTDLPVVSSITKSNDFHIKYAFQRIKAKGVNKIGFLGLGFKENTDDLRESPYVTLAGLCLQEKYQIWLYDENINLKNIFGANLEYLKGHIPNYRDVLLESKEILFDHAELIIIAHPKYIISIGKHPGILFIDLTGKIKKKNEYTNVESIIV